MPFLLAVMPGISVCVAGWFSWSAFALLLILLALPIISFCAVGWPRRRASILGAFTDESAREYLRRFHASELGADDHAKEKLVQYYHTQFARLSFLVPAILLLAVAATLLAPCALSTETWIAERDVDRGILPLVVVLAIGGGYMWVLFDLIYKAFSELLLPRDLYWGSFRFVVCVPAGYAIARAFAPDLQLALAFCLGAFPTKTIFTMLRRVAGKAGLTQGTDQPVETEVQLLPGVDLQKSEILADEGISSICQLANADPVRLAIRTGLSFGYIVGVIGDAILWCYLGDKVKTEAFRLCGLNGAYDCRLLLEDLWNSPNDHDRADAAAIVTHLSSVLKVPEGAILNLLWNVAYDPTAKCIFAIWG